MKHLPVISRAMLLSIMVVAFPISLGKVGESVPQTGAPKRTGRDSSWPGCGGPQSLSSRPTTRPSFYSDAAPIRGRPEDGKGAMMLSLRGGSASEDTAMTEGKDLGLEGGAEASPRQLPRGSTTSSGARACDIWDMMVGPGRPDYCPEFNFTVLRNRLTGSAVEFVHDDDEDMMGFFRFLSSDILDYEPDYPIYREMWKTCPGHVCFVNGYHTGDFLQASNLYLALTNSPGESSFPHLLPNETLPIGISWTARVCRDVIIIQHVDPGCSAAHLVLTASGFTYVGCKDARDIFKTPPQAVVLEGDQPPRHEPLRVAWVRLSHVLTGPPPEEHDVSGGLEQDLGQENCPSGRAGGA